ncbi:uncharacterized protein LOC104883845 [Beta vulgaris subsp. vulgaris]|uniref:uncharacterized protein LOC104883845 n=1 Tax=Beta vulgaris subsp. vulgaris TaxID=3555 RepID=UPI00053F7BCB|nr:uncharacterized protein LOC104883845 [Beta vulgaris subsp. vulgaris]
MHTCKAPDPDGMHAIFYQRFWHVVGDEVVKFVCNILHGHSFPDEINCTNIALIPKVASPQLVSDFRPISLCNVLYKIASKALVIRLKNILLVIVTENQSAFVPERMITDNSLIALELFHTMKQRNNSRTGIMAMKLDMSKAYDRVEWGFLRRLLLTMGFDGRWVNLVMKCVTNVSYSFVINGSVRGSVSPDRGLRQGDPLSPFLFILVADAFSQMIQHKIDQKILHGAKASWNDPVVSHLLFADDSLLFTRATRQECLIIVDILNQYEKASGQKINYDKSEVSFSKGVRRERKEELINLLQMKHVEKHQKYLGIPTATGSSKKLLFRSILDRMWKKLRGWKEQLLSRAGKEVLIKAVIQAIPTYLMGVYKFPAAIIHEISSAMARFWWGGKGEARKMHWISWEKLCKPKCLGGMGFKDLAVFNDALLGRQVWRLIHFKNSLLSRVMKAKYYPRCEMLNARLGFSNSYSWRSIWGAKSLVREGLMWRVGSGNDINIWSDPWVADERGRFIESEEAGSLNRVAELINPDTMEWRSDLLNQYFTDRDRDCILAIPLSVGGGKDDLMWAYSQDGSYTVKTTYMLGKGGNLEEFHEAWVRIWKLEISPKSRHFMWRLCTNSLPVRAALKARHLLEVAPCPWCPDKEETWFHALMGCERIRSLWSQCGCEALVQGSEDKDVKEMVRDWSQLESKLVQRGCVLAWNIWFERNKFVFENTSTPLAIVAQLVFVNARSIIRMARWPPNIAEAKAIFLAISWAKKQSLKDIIVESDAQVIVSRLSRAAVYFSDLDGILGDALSLCSCFHSISFSHVKRSGNFVAHHLAKVVPFGFEQAWVNHCPNAISSYVLMDALSIG